MQMEEMLKRENVCIREKAADWQDAVRISLEPLIEGGYVEARYIQGIIDNTVEMGPYYVITDELALIHGRPEQGAIEKQLAVTVLREPVAFSEEKNKVRLLVVLAATDADSHLEVMRTLAGIFMDEEKMQKILHAEEEEEIFQYFMS